MLILTDRTRRTIHAAVAGLFLLGAVACGGGGGGDITPPPPPPLVASTVAAVTPTTQTGTVGQGASERPTVVVSNQNGGRMAGATVTFAVTAGGGSVTGGVVTTGADGSATVGGWMLGTTPGTNTLTATVGTLAPITFTATASAGPAASLTKVAGDSQTVATGTAVPVNPAVMAKDALGNVVAGVTITFAVTGGGGTVTGASQTTVAGIATVGSWTVGGAAGTNALTASAAGLAGSPITFTATAVESSSTIISAISPATLTPGASATIQGSGFGGTASTNVVTIDGITASITSASATQLTITVPATLPCEPVHDASVKVTVGAASATKAHPLRVAKVRALAAGEALVIGTLADVRCNELAGTGGRYLITVFNANRVYSPTPATFELRGASSAAVAASVDFARIANAPLVRATRRRAPRNTARARQAADSARMHYRVLEQNIELLARNRHLLRRSPGAARTLSPGPISAAVVGDQLPIRIPDLNSNNFCQNYLPITTRVAYVGPRSMVLEDITNPLVGQIDSTYASIGTEFENTMFGILQQNFGNPLAMDARTANTGKVVMVFSKQVNTSFEQLAGFVVTCDFFPQTTFQSSNFGQYFYATAPTVAGDISTLNTPPRWRWAMRGTIIHEVKHITSFAERISRNAGVLETSWLEESTARISEELYERFVYTFPQRGNIGYGSAANPVGPYCGVRLSCGKPRGFVRAFEDLARNFYPESGTRSPIGRLSPSDFSFYATGWSLVRWAIDHGALSESSFLQTLTQSTSLSGLANLEAGSGRSFTDMQPEWLFAMATDDMSGFTPANTRLRMPSWNLRDVFAGLRADFPSFYPNDWPLVPWTASFGNFLISSEAVSGTGSFVELGGAQTSNQLLELRAAPGMAAPAELRIAIVRTQ